MRTELEHGLLGAAFIYLYLHVGHDRPVFLEDRLQDAGIGKRSYAEAQQPAFVLQRLHLIVHGVNVGQEIIGKIQEDLPGRRDLETAIVPFQKHYAEFFFEITDSNGYCRLGHVKFLAGFGNAAEAADRLKITQLGQSHSLFPPFSGLEFRHIGRNHVTCI